MTILGLHGQVGTMTIPTRTNRTIVVLATTGFAALVLTGCGGAGSDPERNGSSPPTPSPVPSVTEPVPAPTEHVDGLIVFTQDLPHGDGRQTTIRVMDPDGSNVRTILAGAWQPTWSPDGTQIAYSDFAGDVTQVFVMGADGTGARQLTELPYGAENPTWSPDGTWLAYTVYDEDVSTSIWIARAVDGTDATEVVPAMDEGGNPTMAWEPAWGPDDLIAFSGAAWTAGGQQEDAIFTIRSDGTGMTRLTSGTGSFSAQWSPDGNWLAFERYHGNEPTTIQVIRADGTDERQLVDMDGFQLHPSWSPDGSRIVFGIAGAQGDGPTGGLWVVDVDGTHLRQLYEDGSGPSWQRRVDPQETAISIAAEIV